MSCRIRELGGANARPNAEALGKADQEEAGLMRLGSAVYQVENVRFGSLADMLGCMKKRPLYP
jgi:hypothetical protein